jgi:phage portal protein BeeE
MKTKPKKLRVKVRRQTRSNLRTPDAWLRDILVGDSSSSGMIVNESNCLTAVVVYACVRNLSEDIAKLPLFLYRKLKPRAGLPSGKDGRPSCRCTVSCMILRMTK